MKNKLVKLLTVALAAVCVFSFVGCSGNITGPTYSGNQDFTYFSYSSMNDGRWNEYGTWYDTGNDYSLDPQTYRDYLDNGMDIMYINWGYRSGWPSEWGYKYDDFETSELKKRLDIAAEVGVKCMWRDERLWALFGAGSLFDCVDEDGTEWQGTKFETEAEFDAYIYGLISPYANHRATWGVVLQDEPAFTNFKAYGQIYQSIKKQFPHLAIYNNLMPPSDSQTHYPEATEELLEKYSNAGSRTRSYARYDAYLNEFLDLTGADYICYDAYPMYDPNMHGGYIGGMQVAATVAKERGVDFWHVSQTVTSTFNGSSKHRRLTEADLRYLNNAMVSFGIKTIGYWNYFTRAESNLAEYYHDNCSFVNHFGEKTHIWYIEQQIHKENKAFAPTMLSFDFNASATIVYEGGFNNFDLGNADHTAFQIREGGETPFAKVDSVSINKEGALINELYDKKNDRYMYAVMNVIDPKETGNLAYQTVTLHFSEDYNYVVVWRDGKRSLARIENNTFYAKNSPGEAVYVIPFKA